MRHVLNHCAMRRVLWLALLLPAGCAAEDPLTREGTWQPTGANEANLRAMIADPQDLVTGVADRRADGSVVAAAVARYRAGKLKSLPDASASKISPISVGAGGGSASGSDN